MSKLDDLRALVKRTFEAATDKESIEKSVELNRALDDVQKEQDELTKKNGELVSAYKDLINHTSFKDVKTPEPTVKAGDELDFNTILDEFITEENNKKKGAK